MKRNNIDDERFRVEWVSAGEGKKWQGIMMEMSEVAERNREASLAAAKPRTTKKKKQALKKSTKAKSATKAKPKKTSKKKQSKK